MYSQEESSDEGSVRRRTDRSLELSAMLKEKGHGSLGLLQNVLARFCLQEGVSKRKGNEYLTLLKTAGLIVTVNGHKSWRYEPEAEWDLFKVRI